MGLPVSKAYLAKLEELVVEGNYTMRYAKGSFKSSSCIVNDQKVVMLNGFLSTDGKIGALALLLTSDQFDRANLSEASLKVIEQLKSRL